MYQAIFNKITLNFKRPSGTSRGILNTKDSWILKLWEPSKPGVIGKGEASIIKTLSPDWDDHYESMLQKVASDINFYAENLAALKHYPSIQFAIETALLDLANGGQYRIFKSEVEKVPINGLVWMGSKKFMLEQVDQKIKAGFNTIKIKIGAINFEQELEILQHIRNHYSAADITIRVDANGAFDPATALKKLERLNKYEVHSIEQPIKAGQWAEMKTICANSPLDVALDEELIGIYDLDQQKALLTEIKPQYIILKPSLIGGIAGTNQWIEIAEQLNINWWITSALESNIGLNAIAQYTATKNNLLPQGLGTGGLYSNNIEPFLEVKAGYLYL